MSPASRPARARAPKAPRPWQRAEAGRYRSADERFTLESVGGSRWFVTDAASLDELGLPRTTGPFPTLDAAKAAAEAARSQPAAASPLAARLADAATGTQPRTAGGRSGSGTSPRRPTGAQQPEAPPPRTWLDELAERDPDAARVARRQVAALEREGIADAEVLVRQDVLGDQPAVAVRRAALAVLDAMAALPQPSAVQIADAVAGALASAPARDGLPGWELRERDGPPGRHRSIRLTRADLEAAAQASRRPSVRDGPAPEDDD